MTFTTFEKSFQEHVLKEACWNIPTPIRMGVVSRINELRDLPISDGEKIAAFYIKLQETIAGQPNSELETRQLVSLKSFMNTHVWFDEASKIAILNDLVSANAETPLPA